MWVHTASAIFTYACGRLAAKLRPKGQKTPDDFKLLTHARKELLGNTQRRDYNNIFLPIRNIRRLVNGLNLLI